MRSYIVQISASPIPMHEVISPYDYCDEHWFNREVADFISFNDCTEDAFADFVKRVGDAEKYVTMFPNVYGTGIVFKKGFKEAYFDEQYVKLRDAIQKLSDAATATTFRDGELEAAMYILRESYDDKLGVYVESDWGLLTLNEFVRHIAEEVPYYFGGAVGYHY